MTTPLLPALLVSLLGLVAAPPATSDTAARAAAPYAVTPFHARASDNDRLERAWRAWVARKDTVYTTVVGQSCFCPPRRPLVTRVKGRTVTSVTRQDRTAQLRQHGYEMPRLYRLLREGYRSADKVLVSYRAGVPVSIYIDYNARVADEELVLSVRVG